MGGRRNGGVHGRVHGGVAVCVGARVVGRGDGPVGVVDGRQRRRGVDLGMLGGRVVGGGRGRVERLALGPRRVVVVVLLVLVGRHGRLGRHLGGGGGGGDSSVPILGHQVVRVVRPGLAGGARVVGLSILQS